ncbi:MAG: type II secretion system protein GspM [Thermoleophilia bacterium]
MKLTKRDTMLLAIIGIIAVLGGAYWFVVKPAKAELSTQQDQLAQVQSESADLRDTLTRMSGTTQGEAQRVAERLRLAKALPETTETPGVVVQLQRLADRANVELTSIKTNNYSDYGTIRGTEFEVRITGRFFDVDDFLYRLHRQVAVDAKDRPIVGGRLFATTSVDLTLGQDGGTGSGLADEDSVVGTIKVVAFSSVPAGASAAAAPATSAPGTAVAAPATPTASAGGGTVNEPSTGATPPAGGGGGQATATPSPGGTQ